MPKMNCFKSIFSSGLIWVWIAILVLLLDRFSKFWVLNHLIFFQPVVILPVLNLTLTYNTGAAFSFLHTASGWQNIVLGGLAVIVSFVIICWLAKLSARAYLLSIALNLILGGALGNAWDRVLYGYVVDFLSFHLGSWHFAIFNVADSAICVGALMLMIDWLRQPKP